MLHAFGRLEVYWDSAPPARNAPEGAKLFVLGLTKPFSRFALIAGGTPAVPVIRKLP
jgi:hypothetical protein